MDPIRIVIADDHPMVAEGIANMLRPYTHLHLVASYETGADLLAGLNLLLPDVLLLDIQFPDTTGNELARIIRQKYSKIKILVVTSIDNPFHIKDMLRQGCLGYVLKSIRPALLVTAIEQVYRGKIFLEEGLKEELLLSVADASGKTSANHIRLTKREQEILELVCEGA